MRNAPSASPSEQAMHTFCQQSPDLFDPCEAVQIPGMPTLPDLKARAQERKAEGLTTIDQSAGCISALNQPMNADFIRYRNAIRSSLLDSNGKPIFPYRDGEVSTYPANYQREYPMIIETLARSWGIENTPVKGIQTVSGRMALDLTFKGLVERGQSISDKQPALIMDPFAWSGYKPLAAEKGIKIIYSPIHRSEGSLNQTAESASEALKFAQAKGYQPVGYVPVIPSNPTGLGMNAEELETLAKLAALSETPLLIDAFYSPLDERGHSEAVNFRHLEKNLPAEVLKWIGMIVGETKVTDSQKKTGTMLWMAPEGNDYLAQHMYMTARKKMAATNTYPRPDEVLTSIALHQYPEGIHQAMGPRWEALVASRQRIKQMFDDLGLPLSIGGSFYGQAALVDPSGETLIRDSEKRPVEDPLQSIDTLMNQYGIVGAPGLTFRSSPSAGKTIRLTATATREDIQNLHEIFGSMLYTAETTA